MTAQNNRLSMILEVFVQLSVICLTTSLLRERDPSKISNAHSAFLGEFPSLVHLFLAEEEYHPKAECGGVIISETVVLTACECLAKPGDEDYLCWNMRSPNNSYVVAGVRDRNDVEHGFTTPAIKFQIHHKCRFNGFGMVRSDLGFVTVAKKFDFNIDIKPALVSTSDFNVYLNQLDALSVDPWLCEFAGWGLMQGNGGLKPPDKVQVSKAVILARDACDYVLCSFTDIAGETSCIKEARNSVICGKFMNETHAGDAGGPLICNGRLFAIISNIDFRSHERPTIFTTIEDVLDMIQVDATTFKALKDDGVRSQLTDLGLLWIVYFTIHRSTNQ